VKALGLKHMSYFEDGVDIEEYMTNVGFYINMDGVGIFHSGDTDMANLKDFITSNKRWDDPVDVAFIYYGVLNDRTGLDYLLKTLNPRNIVVMHVPPSLNEIWKGKVEELKKTFPNIALFQNSLESETLKK